MRSGKVSLLVSLLAALNSPSKIINKWRVVRYIIKQMKKILIASGVAVLAVAMIAGAQGYAFNTNLTVGSTGADVVALQTWLISSGYNISAIASGAAAKGYFGSQTKAAVQAYQTANGVPSTGFVGPLTRGKLNGTAAVATVATGCPAGYTCTLATGNTLPAVVGGSVEGALDKNLSLGDVETTLDEADVDAKVVGVEFRAHGSDEIIQRADVVFSLAASSGSTRLDRYVTSVSLWLNGQKLATLPATQATRDGSVSTLRFAGLSGKVSAEQTARLYVTVDAVSTIATAENGQNITVQIPASGVRAVDTSGITDTFFSSAYSNVFSVGTATGGTLTISEATTNPLAAQVKADANNTVTGVTLTSFTLRAKNSAVTITDLPIGLSVTGANVNSIVSNVTLKNGATALRTKSVSDSASSSVVVFDNINLTIPKDGTVTLTVVGDIKKFVAPFTTGDTLTASTTKELTGWSVEDAAGDAVTSSGSDLKGSATGGTVTFRATGVSVVAGDISVSKNAATVSGQGDQTQYTIKFAVSADDEDLFIDKSNQLATSPSSAGAGIAWATTTTSTSGSTDAGSANMSAEGTNTGDITAAYKVNAGSTRVFTLNVTLTATSTGYTGVRLTGINYTTDSAAAAGAGAAEYYTAGLENFKTNDVSMRKI